MWEAVGDNAAWVFSGAGTAIGAGLLAWWRHRQSHEGHSSGIDSPYVRVLHAPRGRRYNHEFYDYLIRKIRAAKRDIWITGDGFDYRNSEANGLAREYVASCREALKRGVNIVRVQTRSDPHKHWIEVLAQLCDERRKGTFQLFALRENVAQIASLCVIDPDDPECAIVSVSLSTERMVGTSTIDLAGTCLFVERDVRLGEDVRTKIVSLTGPAVAVRLTTADEVRAYLGRPATSETVS